MMPMKEYDTLKSSVGTASVLKNPMLSPANTDLPKCLSSERIQLNSPLINHTGSNLQS